MQEFRNELNKIRSHIEATMVGQKELVDHCLTCVLAQGHMLITGRPGLGKTTLVRTLAHGLGHGFKRIQFTPDLMPSDITGSEILQETSNGKDFEFRPGPLFSPFVLADEINRANPRTQSSLLEAMQERTCTVGNETRALPWPFLVFATQNPIESEGTFPLPEAQLDRFLMHCLIDYPDSDSELEVLKAAESNTKPEMEDSSITLSEESLKSALKQILVPEPLFELVQALVESTRPESDRCHPQHKELVDFGAGTRGGLSLIRAAKCNALLHGDTDVTWSHVTNIMKPCLRHRLRLSATGWRNGYTEDKYLEEVLEHFISEAKIESLGVS